MAGTSLSMLKNKSTAQKAFPETAKLAPDFFTLTSEMMTLNDEFIKAVGPLQKKLLSKSRKLYTKSDKLLKELKQDKQKNKYEIERMLTVRKYAYNLATMMKSDLIPY